MWTLNPRRPPKRSKRDPNNHLGSIQDRNPIQKMATKDIPSAVETSLKGKEMVTESLHRPDVDTKKEVPSTSSTKEVPSTSSKVPSNGIMEEFVSQMTTMLSKIVQHHGHANQRLASLEEDLTHAKLEEEKLKATIEALEKEKSEMNAKVALMERNEPLRFVGSQDGRLSNSQPSWNDWRFQKPQPHHHQKMGGDR
ncbi:hypothetical protein R1flu_005216 [Riccia fluitans]|uniref:Uncharacterized protein n=1 Tax=Riccia fluitans TaxID=41844 RepID=A0ABD1YSI1_9MARC